MVGVVKFCYSSQLCLLRATLALQRLILFELRIAHHRLYNPLIFYLLQEIIRKSHFLSNHRRLRRKILLRLRIKCWILHEAVYKYGKMILDLRRCNVAPTLVPLVDNRLDVLCNLVGDKVHMSAPLCGCNAIHKGDLLETPVRRGRHAYLKVVHTNESRGHIYVIKYSKIRLKVFHRDLFVVQVHGEFLPSLAVSHRSGNIVRTFGDECHGILVKTLHVELFKIGPECDLGIVTLLHFRGSAPCNLWLFRRVHVVPKDLTEFQPLLRITAFDDEFGREDVC